MLLNSTMYILLEWNHSSSCNRSQKFQQFLFLIAILKYYLYFLNLTSDYSTGNGGVFMKLADALRDDFRFAHVNNADILAASGLEGKIVLQRPRAMKNKFEEGDVEYSQEKYTGKLAIFLSKNNYNSVETYCNISVGILKAWVRENALGKCPVATQDNFRSLARPLVAAFYNVDYNLDPKGTQYWRNRVMKVGLEFENLNLAIGSSKDFSGMINGELGGDKSAGGKPMVVIFDENDKKYIMEEEFTPDGKSLRAFIEKYNAGEVEAFVKSEPVPESQGKKNATNM